MIHGVSAKSTDLSIGKDNIDQSGPPLTEKNLTEDVKAFKTISPSTTLKVTAGENADNLSETTGFILNLLLKDGADLIKMLAPFFSEPLDLFSPEKTGMTPYSKENIINLRNLIFSFSLKSENPDLKFLPRLIEKSGLLFEKKISDLLRREIFDTGKTTDFKKISSLFKKDITDTEFKKIADQDLKATVIKLMADSKLESDILSHSIKNYSKIIEKFQIINSHFSESGRFLIPFPVFFNGSLNFGQLLFNLGNKKKEEKHNKQRIFKVSLLLTMSELGPLRVDMALLRKEISGLIQVADGETLDFVRMMIPEFKARLKKHDFNVLSMKCEVAAPKNIDYKVFLNDILKDEDKGLNIVI